MGGRVLTLGLDTSGRAAGAALLEGDALLGEAARVGPHSSLLLPMIRELLAEAGRSAGELGLVAVARGPGSYTGLRVGVVTAKALGWATGARVVGVPTLEVFASHAPAGAARVLVAMRAYKRRVLAARFVRAEAGAAAEPAGPPDLVAADALDLGEADALVTDAADLLAGLPVGLPLIALDAPLAAAVGRAGARRDGEDETLTLAPVYVRPPSITWPKGGAR